VLGLQKGLKALGRYKAAPDGIYGRLTRQSILDFERRFALTPTGRPSRALLATVEAAAAAPTTARKEIVAIFSNPSRGANDVIAVDPETGAVGRAAPEKGEGLDATSERALAACRLSGGAGCRLFAVGDEIVFESTPEEAARLIAARQAAAPLAPDTVPPAEPTGQSR